MNQKILFIGLLFVAIASFITACDDPDEAEDPESNAVYYKLNQNSHEI
jgi:hypothetical protein